MRLKFRSSQFNFGILILLNACLIGCATAPPAKPISTEDVVKRNRTLSGHLVTLVESKTRLKKDVEVSGYLEKVAEKFAKSSPELKTNPIKISLIQDRDGKWQSYSLPGNRIYLSVGLLRKFETETELAAMIAIQVAHLLRRDVYERVSDFSQANQNNDGSNSRNFSIEYLFSLQSKGLLHKLDFLGPGGIFDFSEDIEVAAMQAAVDMMYRSGYDARGLITLCQYYLENQDSSPFTRAKLEKMLEETRRKIAVLSPLRNPIVRSQSFLLIRRRIQRL